MSDYHSGIFRFCVHPICYTLYLHGPNRYLEYIAVCLFVCDSFSGSSQRGGVVVQDPRQMPQSPTDVTCLALPDMGVEDVLELQLQQLTLAQFTVATMEYAIPLLKTGRNS